MSLRERWLRLAICLVLAVQQSAAGQAPTKPDKPDLAAIKELIQLLGSSDFTEREAAMNRLAAIGEPALGPLQESAKNHADPEVRRRAERLAQQVDSQSLDNLYNEGLRQHEKKDYRKAAESFGRAIDKGKKKYHPDANGPGPVPFLTGACLGLARAQRASGNFEEAGNAYCEAFYYANERRRVEAEWAAMIDTLLDLFEKEVKAKVAGDATMQALLVKYPLIILHSRRYAKNNYFRCVYSFIYESSDENKHFNDVQLQFDNGRRDCTMSICMLVGQENQITDLGRGDFTKDPDIGKIKADPKVQWSKRDCKAVDGHLYLEWVKDNQGNDFYVLFQVVAADKESRYMAFIWRRLPGGKIVKQN